MEAVEKIVEEKEIEGLKGIVEKGMQEVDEYNWGSYKETFAAIKQLFTAHSGALSLQEIFTYARFGNFEIRLLAMNAMRNHKFSQEAVEQVLTELAHGHMTVSDSQLCKEFAPEECSLEFLKSLAAKAEALSESGRELVVKLLQEFYLNSKDLDALTYRLMLAYSHDDDKLSVSIRALEMLRDKLTLDQICFWSWSDKRTFKEMMMGYVQKMPPTSGCLICTPVAVNILERCARVQLLHKSRNLYHIRII